MKLLGLRNETLHYFKIFNELSKFIFLYRSIHVTVIDNKHDTIIIGG